MDRRRDMRLLVVLLTLAALALPSTPADANIALADGSTMTFSGWLDTGGNAVENP